jgi:hypothetical protein
MAIFGASFRIVILFYRTLNILTIEFPKGCPEAPTLAPPVQERVNEAGVSNLKILTSNPQHKHRKNWLVALILLQKFMLNYFLNIK